MADWTPQKPPPGQNGGRVVRVLLVVATVSAVALPVAIGVEAGLTLPLAAQQRKAFIAQKEALVAQQEAYADCKALKAEATLAIQTAGACSQDADCVWISSLESVGQCHRATDVGTARRIGALDETYIAQGCLYGRPRLTCASGWAVARCRAGRCELGTEYNGGGDR